MFYKGHLLQGVLLLLFQLRRICSVCFIETRKTLLSN
nr:MAG TPA: hypothetical protein [Caudoviricetes sp.]